MHAIFWWKSKNYNKQNHHVSWSISSPQRESRANFQHETNFIAFHLCILFQLKWQSRKKTPIVSLNKFGDVHNACVILNLIRWHRIRSKMNKCLTLMLGGDWSRSWMRIFKKTWVRQHWICGSACVMLLCFFFVARCPAWDSSHNSNLTGDLQFQYARYVINLLKTTHE